MRSRIAAAVIVVTALLLGTGQPAAAAQAAPPVLCTYFKFTGWADTCFQPDGDHIWVNDMVSNGWSPEVKLEASYPAEGMRYKTRYCAHIPNFPWNESNWDSCNYDHRETHCVRWYIFERSIEDPAQIRNWWGPTPWVGADDGQPGNCVIE
jgi:hypothetical protein